MFGFLIMFLTFIFSSFDYSVCSQFFCSSIVCQKIQAEGGLKLLIDTVKDPNTTMEQLEKVLGFTITYFLSITH
jgi:hypothetical protein